MLTLWVISFNPPHIAAWSWCSILSMALISHVSSGRLLGLCTGHSPAACSLPFAMGCPIRGKLALGPGVGDSSHNVTA